MPKHRPKIIHVTHEQTKSNYQPSHHHQHQHQQTFSIQDNNNDNVPSSFRVLFTFTNLSSQWKILSLGIISAILKGISAPAAALLVGRIIGLISTYPSSSSDNPGGEMLSQVRKYIVYLIAVGVGSMFAETTFYASWVMFGEKQAFEARKKLISGLLGREMEWFDRRKEGSALVSRLNT